METKLKQKLTDDLKQALRDRDKVRRSTFRLVIAAIQNAEIARQARLVGRAVEAGPAPMRPIPPTNHRRTQQHKHQELGIVQHDSLFPSQKILFFSFSNIAAKLTNQYYNASSSCRALVIGYHYVSVCVNRAKFAFWTFAVVSEPFI